jgi:hypothetical protein
MRRLLLPTLAAGLVLGLVVRANAQEPRAIIEKAIKAHGGADKLDKHQASRMKSKGTVNLGGAEIDFNLESASQLPDKLRNAISIEIMGQRSPSSRFTTTARAGSTSTASARS